MIPHDLHNTLEYIRALSPDANNNLGTTALSTSIIDMKNRTGLEFVITTGDLTDADAVYAVAMLHGDAVDDEANPATITDEAAVDDVDMLPSGTGQEAAAGFAFGDDDVLRKLGYVGTKRFVRLTITPTTAANSGDSDLAVLAICKPRLQGTAN
jgi:hypothetical protein